MHHAAVGATGLDLFRPAHQAGNAHSSFVVGILGPPIRRIHFFTETTVIVGKNHESVFLISTFVDRSHNTTHRIIETLQRGVTLAMLFNVTRNFFQWSVDRIEGNIHKQRLLLFLPALSHAVIGNHIDSLAGDQVGGVSRLVNRLLITMPIINNKAGGRIVKDALVVVIDAPAVMPILMHEALTHRELSGQPLPAMPFPGNRGEVSRVLQNLGHGALISIHSMNPARFFSRLVLDQFHPELRKITRLTKVLRTPVTPGPEGVAPGKKGRTGRGTDRMDIEIIQTHTILAQLVDMRGQLWI